MWIRRRRRPLECPTQQIWEDICAAWRRCARVCRGSRCAAVAGGSTGDHDVFVGVGVGVHHVPVGGVGRHVDSPFAGPVCRHRLRGPAHQAQRALVPQGPPPARQPQPAARPQGRHHPTLHLLSGSVVRGLLQRWHQQMEISPAMPRGLGPEPAQVQLAALCNPRTAGRCTAKALQGMGNYQFDIRGGPRTFWPSPRPEYNGNVQGVEHQCGFQSVSHAV